MHPTKCPAFLLGVPLLLVKPTPGLGTFYILKKKNTDPPTKQLIAGSSNHEAANRDDIMSTAFTMDSVLGAMALVTFRSSQVSLCVFEELFLEAYEGKPTGKPLILVDPFDRSEVFINPGVKITRPS